MITMKQMQAAARWDTGMAKPESEPPVRVQPVVSQRRCLAFLQNMWVRNPDRVRAMIARHGEEYRRRFMEYALFAGCLTGRRILKAFPDWVLAEIRWEESTREICGDPRTIPAADSEHIKAALNLNQPRVVLTFGCHAYEAVRPLWHGTLIRAPHPAARHKTVTDELTKAALQLAGVLALANNH